MTFPEGVIWFDFEKEFRRTIEYFGYKCNDIQTGEYGGTLRWRKGEIVVELFITWYTATMTINGKRYDDNLLYHVRYSRPDSEPPPTPSASPS